jgi:hypothetical protein
MIPSKYIPGKTNWPDHGLDYWRIKVWFPAQARNICLLHSIQTNSGVYPISCPLGALSLGGGITNENTESLWWKLNVGVNDSEMSQEPEREKAKILL